MDTSLTDLSGARAPAHCLEGLSGDLLRPLRALDRYDEVFADSESMRPQYLQLVDTFGEAVLFPDLERQQTFINRPFDDDIKIVPRPLLLTKIEQAQIIEGTQQMIRALSMFFEDIVLGEQGILDHPEGVPRVVIDAMLSESQFSSLPYLRKLWEGRSSADITFQCGIDLTRGPAGQAYVIEVNVSDLGGKADNYFAHKHFADSVPLHSTAYSMSVDPAGTVTALAEAIGVSISENTTVAFHNPYQEYKEKYDRESSRWSSLMEDLGAELCSRDRFSRRRDFAEVAMLVNDSSYGLDEPFSRGVKLLNAPGVDALLSNKLLLPYLTAITNYYLAEDPTLQVPHSLAVELEPAPTAAGFELRSLANGKECFYAAEQLLGTAIKPSKEAQGNGVLIVTPQTLDYSMSQLREKAVKLDMLSLEGCPEAAYMVIQDYVPQSEYFGFTVNLRPIAQALGNGDSYVEPLPWGRGLPLTDSDRAGMTGENLKVNVSLGAYELVAIAE